VKTRGRALPAGFLLAAFIAWPGGAGAETTALYVDLLVDDESLY
jgi:hypothetical protein